MSEMPLPMSQLPLHHCWTVPKSKSSNATVGRLLFACAATPGAPGNAATAIRHQCDAGQPHLPHELLHTRIQSVAPQAESRRQGAHETVISARLSDAGFAARNNHPRAQRPSPYNSRQVPTDFSAFHGRESQVRAETLARLFEAVHEGIYSGLLSTPRTVTLAANPHLKLMLGFAPETPEEEVRPFDAVAVRRPAGRRRISPAARSPTASSPTISCG